MVGQPMFNNFKVGDPSRYAGQAGFFNLGFQGPLRFQGVMPNFNPMAMYSGGTIFPGMAGFVGNFPASPMFAPGFQAFGGMPLQQAGFNAGTGFNEVGRGNGLINRQRSEARGDGVGDRGRGRGNFPNLPRGPQQGAGLAEAVIPRTDSPP
jgi:hypothetical protein